LNNCSTRRASCQETEILSLFSHPNTLENAIFTRLQADTRRAEARRTTGERLSFQRGRLTPRRPALWTSHSRTCHPPTAPIGPAAPAPFPAPGGWSVGDSWTKRRRLAARSFEGRVEDCGIGAVSGAIGG
jgi:hypothetical protein